MSSPATEPPLISAITVSRNSSSTIDRTIRSVLNQRYPRLEYIVVDGASSDGTQRIIDRYKDRISRFVSEPDHGIYDAMNKGIALASGTWIHLLNADDYYLDPNVLAGAVPHLDPERTNYFSMTHVSQGRVLREYRFPFTRWRLFVSAKVPHPAMIVSADQYRNIGPYDTSLRIAADHDMILRMLKRYPPKFTDLLLVGMEQGGRSASDLNLTYREFKEVTVRHGLPRPIAHALYCFKRWRWG